MLFVLVFRAFAHWITGTEHYHQEIRSVLIAFIAFRIHHTFAAK